VVVMLENRSFDNICGWLYGGTVSVSFSPSGRGVGFVRARTVCVHDEFKWTRPV
jgi:hypothetical protein